MAAKVPWGALIAGGVGAAALVRTFYRPYRAVVADGYAFRCAAEGGCEPAMVIESYAGQAPVYAVTSGRVVVVAPNVVQIASKSEPTVVRYEGEIATGGMQVQVGLGDEVGIGQQIGMAQRLKFSVFVAWRDAAGKIEWRPNEPASWLATHGLRISAKRRASGSAKWCEGGRKLTVPQIVGNCKIKLPTPGAFMLLPVSVNME